MDAELVPGNLSSHVNFDESFELWKKKKQMTAVEEFAKEWGIEPQLLSNVILAYSCEHPDVVPYIDEVAKELDFDKAENKSAGNRLKHVMTLTRILPKWLAETKQKFS